MKKISRRSFLMATGVIAASAALSACGGSSASTSSAGSTAASTAASGSAAQGGGDLVIYSPNSEGLLNATIPLFEEKYGVNVELIQAGTGELVKRIQSEKNDPYADVLFGGSWSLMYTNEDLWEPYVSANDANVIDAYKNKCGFITGNVLDGSVLIVNTDLLGDIKIEGYEDLLNPALKGKIATADPANSSSAFAHLTNMLLAMGGYALFLLYPMAYLIRQSVLDPDTGGFTLAYFTKFFSKSYYFDTPRSRTRRVRSLWTATRCRATRPPSASWAAAFRIPSSSPCWHWSSSCCWLFSSLIWWCAAAMP